MRTDPILRIALARTDRPPCSVFTAEVLREVYGITDPGWYGELNIYDRNYPWSPIGAAARVLGSERVSSPRPGRWHLVQGWRVLDSGPAVPRQGPVPNGHAWLWYALTPERGMALESSETRGIRWPRGDDCTGEPWAARIQPYAAGVRLAVLPHIVS